MLKPFCSSKANAMWLMLSHVYQKFELMTNSFWIIFRVWICWKTARQWKSLENTTALNLKGHKIILAFFDFVAIKAFSEPQSKYQHSGLSPPCELSMLFLSLVLIDICYCSFSFTLNGNVPWKVKKYMLTRKIQNYTVGPCSTKTYLLKLKPSTSP